jgi:hypothetical protein
VLELSTRVLSSGAGSREGFFPRFPGCVACGILHAYVPVLLRDNNQFSAGVTYDY